MVFKVCVYYCFILTKHNTWQKTEDSPSSLEHFFSFWSPSLPPKPSNQILKPVDPLNKSSVQHFPSEEIHLPCLLTWKGGFLSLAAGAALLLGFVKPKSPCPLSNVAAIYCHTLNNLGDLSKCILAAPSLKPKVFMENSVDLLPLNERVNPKTSTNAQLQLM